MSAVIDSTASAGGATAAQAAESSKVKDKSDGKQSYDSNAAVGTLENLRKTAPEVYDLTMQSLAQSFCNEQNEYQKRIHALNKEAYQ